MTCTHCSAVWEAGARSDLTELCSWPLRTCSVNHIKKKEFGVEMHCSDTRNPGVPRDTCGSIPSVQPNTRLGGVQSNNVQIKNWCFTNLKVKPETPGWSVCATDCRSTKRTHSVYSIFPRWCDSKIFSIYDHAVAVSNILTRRTRTDTVQHRANWMPFSVPFKRGDKTKLR